MVALAGVLRVVELGTQRPHFRTQVRDRLVRLLEGARRGLEGGILLLIPLLGDTERPLQLRCK